MYDCDSDSDSWYSSTPRAWRRGSAHYCSRRRDGMVALSRHCLLRLYGCLGRANLKVRYFAARICGTGSHKQSNGRRQSERTCTAKEHAQPENGEKHSQKARARNKHLTGNECLSLSFLPLDCAPR